LLQRLSADNIKDPVLTDFIGKILLPLKDVTVILNVVYQNVRVMLIFHQLLLHFMSLEVFLFLLGFSFMVAFLIDEVVKLSVNFNPLNEEAGFVASEIMFDLLGMFEEVVDLCLYLVKDTIGELLEFSDFFNCGL
jgi:hypothetical protein